MERQFKFKIDDEITDVFFFKGKDKKLENEFLDEDDKLMIEKKEFYIKKSYIYLTKKKRLIIKNLGIIKRSNTPLSKKIFWEKMKPLILENHCCKFTNEQIEKWVKEYIDKDITCFTRRFTVKDRRAYKVEGCLQVQIYDYIPEGETNNLGHGTYFLVPNKKMGVGKSFKKYCTLEEYKNNLTYDDLYLDVVFRELSYFNKNYIPPIFSNKKVKVIPFENKFKQLELW